MFRHCSYCNIEFTINHKYKAKKYCSRMCYNNYLNSLKIVNYCINCGVETYNKFCSSSCSASFNNKKRNCNSTLIYKHNCLICGIETNNPKYCSLSCFHKSLIKNISENIRRARKREAWQRYQAKKRNQTPIDIDLIKIRQIYESCPLGYEVDHIIPISKGGLHHQDNLQIITKKENRKKSNKIL